MAFSAAGTFLASLHIHIQIKIRRFDMGNILHSILADRDTFTNLELHGGGLIASSSRHELKFELPPSVREQGSSTIHKQRLFMAEECVVLGSERLFLIPHSHRLVPRTINRDCIAFGTDDGNIEIIQLRV